MYDEIVAGFDGSDPARNALKMACFLAQKCDARLHIVHVPHHDTVVFALGGVAGYPLAEPIPDPEQTAQAAERLIADAKAMAVEAGVERVKTHQGEGAAADFLLEVAETFDADLIVTGRRGLGNMSALLLGSTSLDVAHHAKCACLTVA